MIKPKAKGRAAPILTVSLDPDRGYIILATSYGATEPAGPRLFRGEPWPRLLESYDSEAEAEADAAELRKYLEQMGQKVTEKKRPT